MSLKIPSLLASIVILWVLSSSLCSAAHLGPSAQTAAAPQTCPDVINSTCSTACQQHICEALGGFYRVSNNVSDPWDNEDGWQVTLRTPCAELVAQAARQATTAARPAVYCSWYGISCCTLAAVASGNCTVANAVAGLDLAMNNLNASLEDPAFQAAIGKLHACGLTVLNLEANNLSGEMVEEGWSSFVNLQLINVANAYVGGTIPSALRHMRNLTSVTLSNNYFYGTLPAWLGELKKLQVVGMGTFAGYDESTGLTGTIPEQLGNLKNLQVLILQSNFLSGTLPPQLCQGGDQSRLVQLSLRSNLLEGSAKAIEGCGNLIKIDISENSFNGSLPASRDWKWLTSYQVAKNNFTGRFPSKLCRTSKLLDRLDVSHNQLSGQIPGQITLLTGVQTLRLGNNKFTGTMTENVYLLPVLKEFDMSNNLFVGTVSAQIEYTYTLQVIDFSNNTGLTGTLPPQMAFLLDLQKVSTVGTSMCCSGITKPFVTTTNASCDNPDRCKTPMLIGGDHHGAMMRCSDGQLLPCFLMFSDIALPREDSSNMRCKYIMRKSPEKAKLDCAGGEYGSYFLGDSVQYLPDMVKDSSEQFWVIDPSYYQYRECSCLQGFMPVWDSSGTMLQCDPEPAVNRRNVIIVAVISAIAILALLAVLVLLAQLYLRTRPKWLRERSMQAKRMQGAPKCGKPGEKVIVSIAVTDVKDYSANMRQYQDLMVKAMGAHNNILRKACHTHAGYVMDQEGDSWTVAFHEPQDAVAFSLQVQQAMAQKVWGMRVPSSMYGHHSLDSLRQEGSTASGSFSPLRSNSMQTQHVVDMGNSMIAAGAEVARLDLSTDNSQSLPLSSPHPAGARANQQQSDLINDSFTSSTGLSSIENSSETESELQGRTLSFSIAHLFSHHRTARRNSYSTAQGVTDGSRQAAASEYLAVSDQQQRSQQKDVRLVHPVSVEAPAGQRHVNQHHMNGLIAPEGQHQGDIESGSSAVGARSTTPSSFSSSISAFLSEGTADLQQGAGSSLGSSLGSAIFTSKRRGVTSVLMHRLSQMTGRNGQSGTAVNADQQPLKLLQLDVRIGIASGPLPHGSTLGKCVVKHRAKKLVSEAAAGGQVLCDESTFLSIKDSLSVLGTVNEGGYDNDLLQSLMHAQVVGKLQRQIVCSPCPRSTSKPEMSFSNGLFGAREPQDYDNDAIVVHMGCFEVPDVYRDGHGGGQSSDSDSDNLTTKEGGLEVTLVARTASKAKMARSARKRTSPQKLHLYSIAAPGMRKWPDHSQGLSRRLCWADAVSVKLGWQQTQKGYFEAPSASQVDLMVTSTTEESQRPSLGLVTVVFATVENGASFEARHSQQECHVLHKAIMKVMHQQLNHVPGKDGYISRSEESEFGYMIAFEQPHKAVQWCLLVQEALLYVSWPSYVLTHPGFEEILCPLTGLPLFRGPRLRMGVAEGHPTAVLPDHNGRANYYGGSVNRAARFMDAAAHGGQVVTDLDLVRKLMMNWVAHDREDELDEGQDQEDSSSLDMPRSSNSSNPHLGMLDGKPIAQSVVPAVAADNDDTNAKDQHDTNKQQLKQPAMVPVVSTQQQVTPASQALLQQQLVSRSNSETSAAGFGTWGQGMNSLPTHVEDVVTDVKPAGRSRSFTAGLRWYPGNRGHNPGRLGHHTRQRALSVSGRAAASMALAAGKSAALSELDYVVVRHLGRFTFKGSGEYDMVQLLHTAILDRTFPAEPPRGKGFRVTGEGSNHGVEDLPVVRLQTPQQLTTTRMAFRVTRFRRFGSNFS